MKRWKQVSDWSREAISPKGAPAFLITIIAFLLSTLVSIYLRAQLG
jgi:hypothetical protein